MSVDGKHNFTFSDDDGEEVLRLTFIIREGRNAHFSEKAMRKLAVKVKKAAMRLASKREAQSEASDD